MLVLSFVLLYSKKESFAKVFHQYHYIDTCNYLVVCVTRVIEFHL
jgi:hypothetical protein